MIKKMIDNQLKIINYLRHKICQASKSLKILSISSHYEILNQKSKINKGSKKNAKSKDFEVLKREREKKTFLE